MSSSGPNCCHVLSYDYLDFDVFLNIYVFYRLAGYRILRNIDPLRSGLVVLLRGIPPRIYPDFTGVVHVYDYVKEYLVDYASYFPSASTIYLVSVSISPEIASSGSYTYIPGYLPIIPQIWTTNNYQKKSILSPLHISNYKPMGFDFFQQQLIQLARLGMVKIYGAKWDKVDIQASILSYFSANRLLAKASHCYGLMYPYQRGSSLSGRMWQAPLHGCCVLSEPRTNIFDCPGVYEVDDYLQAARRLPTYGPLLARHARDYWMNKTLCLAAELNMSLSFNRLGREVWFARFIMYRQHLLSQLDLYIRHPFTLLIAAFRARVRRLLR